jgi:hypothetical protein
LKVSWLNFIQYERLLNPFTSITYFFPYLSPVLVELFKSMDLSSAHVYGVTRSSNLSPKKPDNVD